MPATTQNAPFSGRALTSMLTTGGFLIMGATGLMLYATPEGRLAFWVDWTMAGLTKAQWGAIHVTSSLLFLIAGFLHLWFNWRQFVAYLRHKLQTRVRVRPEAPAAVVLLAALVAGTLWGLPPFTYVLDFSAYLKSTWSVDAAREPPFGHAEEATLKTLALRTASKADEIVVALRDAGFAVADASQTLRQVADVNGVSPADLWVEVVKRVPTTAPTPVDAKTAWTEEAVDARFEGAGFGAKTIEQAAGALGLPVEEVLGKLTEAGIAANRTDRLKTIADKARSSPTELLKIVLVPGYRRAAE